MKNDIRARHTHTSVRASRPTPDQQNLAARLRLRSCCSRSEPRHSQQTRARAGFRSLAHEGHPTDQVDRNKRPRAASPSCLRARGAPGGQGKETTTTTTPRRRGLLRVREQGGRRGTRGAAVVDAGEKSWLARARRVLFWRPSPGGSECA